ncbi:MAG: hypothetical protein DI534_06885 [Leifsonia xyli]|nr:MAG: hypothetical protein DI534_06885 [Leifsonia xyli]
MGFGARERDAAFFGRVLLLAALAVGVIVGLLTMHLPLASDGHQMSGSSMSGMSGSALDTSMTADMADMAAADATASTAFGPAMSCALGCASPASGSDDMTMLMMVCVIALFGIALALAATSGGWRLRLADLIERASVARRVPHPRPPSLHALSISRT